MLLSVAVTSACGFAYNSSADVVIDFDLSGPGGNTITFDLLELTGNLTEIDFNVDFTNDGGWTWAGDLLIGLVDANGSAIEYGGYNMSFGYTNAGDFDGSWDSTDSGNYTASLDVSEYGLGGTGSYMLALMDGYDNGAETDNWNGTITLVGVDYIPAPGAIALFGLAGIASRRRRR